MRTRIVPLFFVSAIFIGAATMPKFPSLSMSVGVHEATIVFGPPRATPSVTGAAYSADEILEQTKTLPDGTHTTQSSVTGHLFRDSQGRMRMEQLCKPGWAPCSSIGHVVFGAGTLSRNTRLFFWKVIVAGIGADVFRQMFQNVNTWRANPKTIWPSNAVNNPVGRNLWV